MPRLDRDSRSAHGLTWDWVDASKLSSAERSRRRPLSTTAATRRVLRIRGLAYHYFISRDGTIHQFMDLKNIAEHAGSSRWEGLTGWNKFSIGICLQGRDNMTYTIQQYASLKSLVEYINVRYPDSKQKPILTHATIAYPRFRKSDPGINFELWRLHHDTTYIPGR